MTRNNLKRDPAQTVSDFHNNDDVDSGQGAHHHTLGPGVNQAARGSDFKAHLEAYEQHKEFENFVNLIQNNKIAALETGVAAEMRDGLSIIPNSGINPIGFGAGSEDHIGNILVDIISAESKFTINEAGFYTVSGNIAINQSGGSVAANLFLFKNGIDEGTQLAIQRDVSPSSSTALKQLNISWTGYLAVGDTLSLGLRQDSSSNQNTSNQSFGCAKVAGDPLAP